MRRTIVFTLVLIILLAGVAVSAPPKQKPPVNTLMYLVNRPASIESFRQNAKHISIIAPQTFSMDADGFIAGEVPAEILEIARKNNVAVMPLVVNRGFNQPLMHTVLDSKEKRARAIRYLLYFALRDGYIGFQFDYENIKYFYRDKFSVFFREAAHEFHKHGLLLTAAVVGKYADDRNSESPGGYDDWSGVYDYKALAKHADFLSIMAYPQHAGFSDPGPLAGVPWVKRIVDYTVANVPAHKVSLGVPLYGHHWVSLADGETASANFVQDEAGTAKKKWKTKSTIYADAMKLAANQTVSWDETEQAPFVTFTAENRQNVAWWEDARSLAPKLELTAQKKLHGISGWVLGHEDPAIWKLIAENYRVVRPKSRLATGDQAKRAKAAAKKMHLSPELLKP